MAFVLILLQGLVAAAWLAVAGRVIVSWLDPGFGRPVSQLAYRLSEPLLAPLRNALPRTGTLDLSPLVLLIGIGLLARVLAA